MKKLWIPSLLALSLCACTVRQTTLRPGPGADALDDRTAVAVREGVRVQVTPGAWKGNPARLEAVTPLLVEIHNEGNEPIQVRYSDLSLVSQQGARLAALPPIDIRGTEVEPVRSPTIRHRLFHVAPHHEAYYPLLPTWRGPYFHHHGYVGRYHPRFVRFDLPTASMTRQAMPEGVLEPGGEIRGFVYFEPVGPSHDAVTFTLDLSRPGEEGAFAEVEIPFRVHGP